MVIRKIRKLFSGLKGKYAQNQEIMTSVKFIGRDLKTIKGTIRRLQDQDDAWFYYLSGQHKRIFDIGANVGYTALMANIQGYADKLLLVDPNPRALAIAAKNLIYNNLAGNCTFISSFVSDQIGEEIPFYTVGAGAAGSMFKGHAESAASVNSYFMVATTTIDELVGQVGWQPDFVKIDVEGAESFVLRGAEKLAASKSTSFMIEMHSPPELPMVENAKRVLAWCHQFEYESWYMKEQVRLESPEQIAHRGKCHLLLQPKGWNYPEVIKNIRQGAQVPNL